MAYLKIVTFGFKPYAIDRQKNVAKIGNGCNFGQLVLVHSGVYNSTLVSLVGGSWNNARPITGHKIDRCLGSSM